MREGTPANGDERLRPRSPGTTALRVGRSVRATRSSHLGGNSPGDLTGHDVDGAYVRYTFLLNRRHRQPAPLDVLPFFVDVNHVNGGTDGFEVPPGGLVVTKQFTVGASGHLLAASGHLHDHAVMMRLEDAANGRTLATVRTDHDSTGHTLRVQRPIFALWHRGRLGKR